MIKVKTTPLDTKLSQLDKFIANFEKMKMNGTYQLIVMGNLSEQQERELHDSLIIKFKDLGVNEKFLTFLVHNSKYTKKYPVYCIYYGGKDYTEESIVESLMNDGVGILPVVKNAPAAEHDFQSKEIKKINAAFLDEGLDKIISVIMENFGLIRKRRKVFISYKRAESRDVAVQMYEKLSEAGFIVFLDTHSIWKGINFQEDLYHQLVDCDVLLLLNTPKFFDSPWTRKEFEKANFMSIGIVQVIWPEVPLDAKCQLTETIMLDASSFDVLNKNTLSLLKIEEIIVAVEQMRIRSFASRRQKIVGNLFDSANAKGEKILNIKGNLFRNEKTEVIYIPEVGYPQSDSFDYARRNVDGSAKIVYDPTNVKQSWIEYLKWLNDSLNIKTSPITEEIAQ